MAARKKPRYDNDPLSRTARSKRVARALKTGGEVGATKVSADTVEKMRVSTPMREAIETEKLKRKKLNPYGKWR